MSVYGMDLGVLWYIRITNLIELHALKMYSFSRANHTSTKRFKEINRWSPEPLLTPPHPFVLQAGIVCTAGSWITRGTLVGQLEEPEESLEIRSRHPVWEFSGFDHHQAVDV